MGTYVRLSMSGRVPNDPAELRRQIIAELELAPEHAAGHTATRTSGRVRREEVPNSRIQTKRLDGSGICAAACSGASNRTRRHESSQSASDLQRSWLPRVDSNHQPAG